VGAAVGAFVALVAAAIAYDVALKPRLQPQPFVPTTVGLSPILTAPLDAPVAPDATLATDASLDPTTQGLWLVDPRGSTVVARRLALVGGRLVPMRSVTIELPAEFAGATFAVAGWRSGATNALFALKLWQRRIDVLAVALTGSQRVLAAGSAPAPMRAGETRDVSIARLSGPLPDLFVVRRIMRTGAAIVTVYSGESSFRRAVFSGRLAIRVYRPELWTVAVADTSPGRPDIAFLLADVRASGSKKPEIHIVSGASHYHAITLQAPLELPSTRQPYRLLLGTSPGGPSVYAVSPGPKPRLYIVRLGTR
jgi:hypothetical protein